MVGQKPFDRPIVLALHGRRKGRREEGRKEGRKIITARAHFGEINRVLITRPSRAAGQGVQAPHGRYGRDYKGGTKLEGKRNLMATEAALLPSIWVNSMMAI